MLIVRSCCSALIVCVIAAAASARAAELQISAAEVPGALPLMTTTSGAEIYADPRDLQPTAIAASLLAEDIQRVTGRVPKQISDAANLSGSAVLIGTIGHSSLIDELISEKKIDVADIRDRWEAYKIQTVDHPAPNVDRALVIVGSDRQGTAYGIVTLSQAIGVSPWYWWADVPVQKKEALYVLPASLTDMPKVQYRGIFINDEAPAMSGWTHEKYGGFNSKMYVHVFELLLRLKANYLWPAMWGNAFNEDDPENPKLANDWGIVMGTSHQEPMLRAQAEFDRRYPASDWNYATHPELMQAFWREGIRRNKDYQSLITIGMRGRNDTPMLEHATVRQSMDLLEQIVAEQRKILAEEMNPDVTRIPQVWCLYKEVQEYYERGLRVPDDVTLLWSDDNWGNLRRLPTPDERGRAGGAGIYYHFDYVGDPRNYKWLNTNPISKVWEQMNLAYQEDANRIWIVNVGDLKPMEFPIDFFLTMAWAPGRMTKESMADYGREWAVRNFGPEHADDIAGIIARYTKYNGRRKPELIDPSTFSLVNYHEADRVSAEWNAAADKAEALYHEIPADQKDAFFELVLYPTKACATVTDLYIAAARNRLYAKQGRASTNDLASQVRALFAQDAHLADEYNHTLADGKWDHMMDQTHIGYTNWQDPPHNNMPQVQELTVPEEAAMGVAIEGSASAWPGAAEPAELPGFDSFGQQQCRIDIFNRGHTPFPFTAAASAPWIQLSATNGTVKEDQRLFVTIDWSQAPQGETPGDITISGTGKQVKIHLAAFKPQEVTPDMLQGFVEENGYVSIEAAHYTAKTDASVSRWEEIPDYGRTLSAMSTFPFAEQSSNPPANSPSLQYRMYLFHTDSIDVSAMIAPTLNFVPGRGLRYAISFDDQPPRVIDALAHNSHRDWQEVVRDNVRIIHTRFTLDKPGYHTLKFWRVDPAVVLEKIVVDCGGLKPSYLGPPETFRHISQ